MSSSTPTTVITLGCRLNALEAEALRARADSAGLGSAGGETVIVNTCAVTAEAVRQAAQLIRRARRERPGARIVVTGCAAQIEPARFAAMPAVDHVIGNAEKLRPATFRALADGTLAPVLVDDIMSARAAVPPMPVRHVNPARTFIEIQNGCDHRCTFCVIPFGRGPSRSIPPGDVVAQVRRLVEAGAREIVLTGVDITAYGADQPGEVSLGRLVRQILRQVPELARLRLSSIDQVEADRHLLDAIAEEPRLMPHLHLSLQAGADLVLKRMKRRHVRADAVEFCALARRLRPGIALGADLIAGFPTETDAQFEDTLAMVEDCGLVFLHVFPFSARQGTPAARMPQQPPVTIKARASRLREVGRQVLAEWLERQIGDTATVAIERRLADGRLVCRTPHYAQVLASGGGAGLQRGDSLRVRFVAMDGERLLAEAAPHISEAI